MKTITTILALLSAISISAQEIVSTAGEVSETSKGSVSWTVGETVIESGTADSYTVNQGFQQITLEVQELSTSEELAFEIKAYPNPASEVVVVEVMGRAYADITLKFYNALGKLIYDQELTASISEIDISSVYFGNYVIKLFNKSGTMLKSFKVIKNK